MDYVRMYIHVHHITSDITARKVFSKKVFELVYPIPVVLSARAV